MCLKCWKMKASVTNFLQHHAARAAFALFTKVNSADFVFFKKNSEYNSLAMLNGLFILFFSKSQLIFFFEKLLQLINFTHTVYVNVNNNFFKKISLKWIKFIRTIISILLLVIFYLILLHAQRIMKTVVLVGWILYVMEL